MKKRIFLNKTSIKTYICQFYFTENCRTFQ